MKSKDIRSIPSAAGTSAPSVRAYAPLSKRVKNFNRHWNDNDLKTVADSKKREAERFLAPLRAFAREKGTPWILDAGCGDGVHAQALSQSDAETFQVCVGVDLAYSALRIARHRAGRNWRFLCADIGKLPFPDGAFDGVFSYGVLAYTDDPAASFGELCRVTRSGGQVGVWLFPKPRGLGGALFRTVRSLCRWGGPFVTRLVADGIVPLLSFLPTSSGLTLRNASWRQCREVVLVNIAPRQLIFPSSEEVAEWFRRNRLEIQSEDTETPIMLWGRKP